MLVFLMVIAAFTWIYLSKSKSDVTPTFLMFQKHVERLLNYKIHAVQSDWGGEYERLSRHFAQEAILHRVSCPHTSQQNGVAEREHRHLVETGIALLAHSSLPVRFWDEAFLASCYLINRMPTRTLQNSTPIQGLFNQASDYSFLRPFGCVWWPNLRPYNITITSSPSDSRQCVFLGYFHAQGLQMFRPHHRTHLHIPRCSFQREYLPLCCQPFCSIIHSNAPYLLLLYFLHVSL